MTVTRPEAGDNGFRDLFDGLLKMVHAATGFIVATAALLTAVVGPVHLLRV